MAKMLIVDDEEDIVEHLAYHFQELGNQIVKAYDGVEAVLTVIRDKEIDLVLMDIRMPRLDGIEALRIIKELRPELPVIMFTGQAGRGDMALSVQLGAFTCMTKPVQMDKLENNVLTLLQKKGKG
jgi:DNA-binding NtrC family response regulator